MPTPKTGMPARAVPADRHGVGHRIADPCPYEFTPNLKPADCSKKRHRYRDSNPGFRTENPVREASFGRFGHVSARFGRWSSVEFAGVGDQFRDQFLLEWPA